MKLWKHQYLLMAEKLLGCQKEARMAPCISRVKCLRRTADYSLLGCERNELMVQR